MSLTETPLTEFIYNAKLLWRMDHLQHAYPGVKAKDLRKFFATYLTDDIDLCLFWDIPGTNRRGHHYVMGVNLSLQSPMNLQGRIGRKSLETIANKSSNALFAQTVKEQKALLSSFLKSRSKEICPIRVFVVADRQVTHDFHSG